MKTHTIQTFGMSYFNPNLNEPKTKTVLENSIHKTQTYFFEMLTIFSEKLNRNFTNEIYFIREI